MLIFNIPFKNPEYLLFIFLFILIFIFYLLAQKRKKITVPYVNFWKKILEKERKSFRKVRFRRFATVGLIFIELSLLTLSIAQPGFYELRHEKLKIAFFVDLKPSMLSVYRGQTRIQNAQEFILNKTKNLKEEDRILICGIKQEPVIVFDGNIGEFNKKFKRPEQIFPEDLISWNGTNIEQSLRYAQYLLEKGFNVIFISDDTTNLGEILNKEENVGCKKVGVTTKNCAIISGNVTEKPLKGKRYISVTLKNFSSEQCNGVLKFEKDGKVIKKEEIICTPMEIKEYSIELDALTGGFVVVNFETESDALKYDNFAYFYLFESKKPDIWFFYRDSLNKYLVKFFEALKADGYEINTKAVEEEDVANALKDVSSNDIVILDNCKLPENTRVRNLIVIGSRYKELPVDVSVEFEKPLVIDWAVNSFLLKDVDLKDLVVGKSAALSKHEIAEITGTYNFQPLIFTDKGIICASVETESLRAICFGFLLEDSNLPLLSAFPIILKNSIEWFSFQHSRHGEFERNFLKANDIRFKTKEYISKKEAKIWNFRSGEPRSDVAYIIRGNEITIEPLAPGFYYLETEQLARGQWFAVNLFDEKLSDISVAGDSKEINLERSTQKIPNYVDTWKLLLKILIIILLLHWIIWAIQR